MEVYERDKDTIPFVTDHILFSHTKTAFSEKNAPTVFRKRDGLNTCASDVTNGQCLATSLPLF